MADEHVGQAILVLQMAEQLHHLHLHRPVERRGRLVQQDELRPQDHRAGNGNALALATRELVRIAVERRMRQLHLVQHGQHPLDAFLLRQFRLMDAQPFAHDLADVQAR